MIDRPADLPDYANPPITEVVLGVQFNSVAGFLSPHLGLIWEAFKTDFPHVEEHPPLTPTFEIFGPNPNVVDFLSTPFQTGMSRVFFVNTDRTQLLQVQRDRFLHNWRKVGEGDRYPRFEGMLSTFEAGMEKVARVLDGANLGAIVPNQCEVTYINQIPVGETQPFDTIEQIFGSAMSNLTLDDLGNPEDTRFLLRYVLRKDEGDDPMGRLIVTAEPGRLANGKTVLQLTLTARGVPGTSDIEGVSRFLQRGRLHIVRAFTKLTSEKMQKDWGRKR
jgi:uncharacterized protein (TIGR04255 family)